ncbi:MAG TPA: SDR family oxidoreductase, partial [Novosphingobium sp.]|nr:SDR family oxidoreductase [Novosphingobium sp.]
MNATSAPEPDFTGRTAIITGAAKGLGRAYALWLAARGCAVVASNRPAAAGPSPLHALVAQIRQSGGRAIAHEGAVEDPQAAAEAVDLACRHFGPPAIFLSNAGVQAWRDFATASLADMRALLDINLWGAILGLKAVWPAMLEAGYGRVVLTSSSAGLWGQQRSADYGASKAAMVGLARSVALDVPAGG